MRVRSLPLQKTPRGSPWTRSTTPERAYRTIQSRRLSSLPYVSVLPGVGRHGGVQRSSSDAGLHRTRFGMRLIILMHSASHCLCLHRARLSPCLPFPAALSQTSVCHCHHPRRPVRPPWRSSPCHPHLPALLGSTRGRATRLTPHRHHLAAPSPTHTLAHPTHIFLLCSFVSGM